MTVRYRRHSALATPLRFGLALAMVLATPHVAPAGPWISLSVPSPAAGTVVIRAAVTLRRTRTISITIDAGPVATCDTSPCVYSWDTLGTPDGNHRVRAAVFDRNRTTPVALVEKSVSVANTRPVGLSLLLQPLTRLSPSADADLQAYDSAMLSLGRLYADGFPVLPDDILSSNYYDLALVLYQLHARTNDPYWLEQARRVASAWRDDPRNQLIDDWFAGDSSVAPMLPPGRGMSTLGLAVLGLESNDAEARRIVSLHAQLVSSGMQLTNVWGLANPYMPFGDAREAGYSLMALVAATILGYDHASDARQLVDVILARQQPDGQWESWAEFISTPFTLNYMTGLLMEALILYDRAIGDPRVLPALQNALNWTWATQWVPDALAFQYANIVADGYLDTTPAPVLSGLLLPAWGYVFAKTQDPRYRDQGNQIFIGLSRQGTKEIYGEKQFAQVYRSSLHYLGFMAEVPPSAMGSSGSPAAADMR